MVSARIRPRPELLPCARNSRSAALYIRAFSVSEVLDPTNSSIGSKASFAANASASRKFTVELQATMFRALNPLPKCCPASAVRSDLKPPVRPARCRLKSHGPSTDRQIVPPSGIMAGPNSSSRKCFLTPSIISSREVAGRLKCASAGGSSTSTSMSRPIAPPE